VFEPERMMSHRWSRFSNQGTTDSLAYRASGDKKESNTETQGRVERDTEGQG